MKKIGYFFYAFLPVLIAVAVQFIGTYFTMGLLSIMKIISTPVSARAFALSDLQSILLENKFSTIIMCFYSVAVIGICVPWYLSRFEGELGLKEFKKFSPKNVFGIIILIPPCQFISSYICLGINYFSPALMEQYEDLLKKSGITPGSISIILLVYSVILAPLVEELVFRGLTLKAFNRAVPFWIANILQAALFGAFHLNWVQGIYAFVLGIILGYIYKFGTSMYCNILFHILFNFWGTILSDYINLPDTLFFNIILVPVTIIVFLFGAYLFISGSKREVAIEEQSGQVRFELPNP